MSSTRSLFDRWAPGYDHPTFQRLTYRPVHDAVLARLSGTDPAVVVDLGCGTGQMTSRLTERFAGATVIGIDLSAGMLAAATARLRRTGGGSAPPLIRADAQRLPVAPSSVDLVVCTESFHWYVDQQRVLEGVAEALRPGGRLLIASIATITDIGDRMVTAASTLRGPAVRARPPGRLRSMLAGSGFEVVHQRRVPRFGPGAWPVLTEARR